MEEETDFYGLININSTEESSNMYNGDGEDTSVNVTVWPPTDGEEEDENRMLAKLFEGYYQENNGDEMMTASFTWRIQMTLTKKKIGLSTERTPLTAIWS